MKKILTMFLLLFLTGCTVGINNPSNNKEKTFLGYISDSNGDMVLLLNTEVYLTTTNNDTKNILIDEATSLLTHYHILLDSHHYYLDDDGNTITNIAVLNDSIGKGPINVEPEIINVLKEAIELTKLTYGYFNFTLGNLSNIYSDKFLPYDTYNEDPDSKEIENLVKGIIPYEKIDEYIIIDEDNSTIELKMNNYPYSIDLGAFSKGYIVNIVYNELKKYNSSFLINAGSSSIAAYSSENDNTLWTIGITNPEQTQNQIFILNLNNGSISTSGDYENYYYLKNGTKRHHILNPFTGYPENYYVSNTLISENTGIIDALSTALFNIENEQEYKAIIQNIEKHYNTDISFLYIQDGLNIFVDKNFSELIAKNESTTSFTYTIIN